MTLAYWVLIPFAILLAGIYVVGRVLAGRVQGPYVFNSPDIKKAFERWQDHQLEQFRSANNTLFALASAALAYSLTLLSAGNQILLRDNASSIRVFTCAFAVSFLLGLILMFLRLEDFRRTKSRHKLRDEKPGDPAIRELYRITRHIGVWTWALLYAQGACFFVGGVTIIYFWMANYAARLGP